jgi:hypothetical protein
MSKNINGGIFNDDVYETLGLAYTEEDLYESKMPMWKINIKRVGNFVVDGFGGWALAFGLGYLSGKIYLKITGKS